MTSTPALDFSTFDLGVRVQDDLYRHVNGAWIARTQIPDDKPVTGAFMLLRDAAEEAVRDIITGMDRGTVDAGSDQAKIADLYASFMDVESVEAAASKPLTWHLTQINSIGSIRQLIELMGTLTERGVSGLIGFETESDPGNPNRYVPFIGQGGLGLPDEEYYRDPSYLEIRCDYQSHIRRMLNLAGITQPGPKADRIFALETAIAACHWDKVKTRDLRLMYNLMPLDQFVASAPGLHWHAFMTGAGIDDDHAAELVVAQPSFFTEVAELLTADRLTDWRDWLTWKLIHSYAPYLSSAFVKENFAFYGTKLQGTPVLRERWKRGVALVEGALGEAVGREYVERNFSPAAKERMDGLVANLIEAYRVSITDLGWMTDTTKAEALTKLSKFRPHIGYPSKWRDYSELQITATDLLGNLQRAASFEFDRSLEKIGKPVDREEWLMTPQTVNAYYHPLRNEIVFPAAILQPPFFNEHADDAVNYGAIGAVIGHEIGHGFDDQGSTCDGDGALRDWWTAADRTAFEERTGALIGQYDALAPAETPDSFVNGKLTIGENIGDLGGLSIALKAFRLSRNGAAPEALDGYTEEQRLFLSWAAVWQSKSRPELIRQRLATDPHSPSEFRCNQIVRNIDDFYAAFKVTESDHLWLNPEERVTIW